MSYILGNSWLDYKKVKRFLIRSGVISGTRISFFGYDFATLLSLARTINRGQYTEVTKEEQNANFFSGTEMVRLEINDVILDVDVTWSRQFHFETYDSLPQYSGIVYMITPQMIRESINELGKMLDDEEITAPILVLFSPPTGERNVENVIRDYNLTDIIEKANGRIALFTFTLSPTQLELSGCMEGLDWLIKKLNL